MEVGYNLIFFLKKDITNGFSFKSICISILRLNFVASKNISSYPFAGVPSNFSLKTEQTDTKQDLVRDFSRLRSTAMSRQGKTCKKKTMYGTLW